MLPDFPKGKKKLKDFILFYLQKAQKKYLGPFADVPVRRYFEGHRNSIQTESGEITKSPFRKVKSEIQIDLQNYEKLSTKLLMKKINKMAEEFAIQRNKISYDEIEEKSKEVGNYIDIKGKPPTPEIFLDILERLFISFDSNGNPKFPQIVTGGEKLAKKFVDIQNEIRTNKEYKSRFEEIIIRKKKDWNEREASRKLVG